MYNDSFFKAYMKCEQSWCLDDRMLCLYTLLKLWTFLNKAALIDCIHSISGTNVTFPFQAFLLPYNTHNVLDISCVIGEILETLLCLCGTLETRAYGPCG